MECTGFYTSAEKSQAHLQAGARKVLISAPAGEMKTIVYNVNDDTLTPDDTIISVASLHHQLPGADGQSSAGCLRHHRRAP